MGGRTGATVAMNDASRIAASAAEPNAPIIVRDACEGDVPAIVGIERASFGDPWSAASFRSVLAAERGYARVAVRGEAVLGYCIAWKVGDEAELANIAVDPAVRRSGVATQLLDDLLALVDAPPGATLYLEVRASNVAAQALYRRRGFEAAGRRKGYYAHPTEDAIVMRRPARG
jgi:[ribosomal protein S18]-alanine N-acetyltransferase